MVVKNTAWTGVTLTDPMIGTVRGIANAGSGSMIKTYVPTAWGEISSDTGVVTRVRMAGQEYDQETGLYLMGARYYDPNLGRFISEDPIGIDGGLNLYAYATNDPINRSDPTGRLPEIDVVACLKDGDYWVDGWGCVSDIDPRVEEIKRPEEQSAAAADNRRLGNSEQAGPSCRGAVLNLLLTAGTDAAFFTGVGTGLKAARAASHAWKWTQRYGKAQKLRAMYAAQRSAIAARGARDLRYLGAEAAYSTGRLSQLGTTLAGEDLATPSFSVWDLVPIAASFRAASNVISACQR